VESMEGVEEQVVLVHPLYERAKELLTRGNAAQAEALFLEVIKSGEEGMSLEVLVKGKELSIYGLAEIYAKEGNTEKLARLLVQIRPFFLLDSQSKDCKDCSNVD